MPVIYVPIIMPPKPKRKPKMRAIRYYRWQRHWYRLLDILMPVWSRTLGSRPARWVGRSVWRVFLALLAALLVVGRWLFIATVIVGMTVTFIVLSFVSGKNSLLRTRVKRR